MDTVEIEIPTRKERKFIPENFKITTWDTLKTYFDQLKDRDINSASELEEWLQDRSELEAVLEEDLAWRYIRSTCETTSKELEDAYAFFIKNIEPNVAPYANSFNEKLLNSPYRDQLDEDKYFIYIRAIKKHHELYREENIPLFTEAQTLNQKYNSINGDMSVTINGKELTMQQASKLLEEQDRSVREDVFRKTSDRRLQDAEKLDELFNQLTTIRHKISTNAGYDNYRDYKHVALGRFDYSVDDCMTFQEAIKEEIIPIAKEMNAHRKEALGLDSLRPWDTEVDLTGKPPLKPFNGGVDLINRSIDCFDKVDPYFSDCLTIMKEMKHVDLESRKGKAPGGYNYPLAEIGVPFIFMNAANAHRDVVTMVHEGGHAVHSFLSMDLEISEFKNVPSEVAELASMSMELISMECWDVFYNDEEELKRAKREQLERVFIMLPWIATIDRFQHWIYTNPGHSVKERHQAWSDVFTNYYGDDIDWTGYEDAYKTRWHAQLHIFEIPFYYIEYAMAQLGAIAVWKNYKENPQQALYNYKEGLKLGYTKTIGDIYETAGIKFNFSRKYVRELAQFVKAELDKV
ncbi:MAG: M3 family oligoendopeptidase [Bacteroidia bacterium]|nr:M3 family oligoendopeptidase [Bacteroidia bacterium]